VNFLNLKVQRSLNITAKIKELFKLPVVRSCDDNDDESPELRESSSIKTDYHES
jgi:hypothetical protein